VEILITGKYIPLRVGIALGERRGGHENRYNQNWQARDKTAGIAGKVAEYHEILRNVLVCRRCGNETFMGNYQL
jgi:hypothetical protein